MKSLKLSLQGFLFVLVLLALPQAAPAAARAQHVFIISLDGGKPAVIQKSPMPVLETMVNEGACTWTAQTIFPSITLPSHTSMLTGVGPAKHHILWNTYKPEAGVVQVATVFSEAKQHGFSTAMFVGKEKFRHLVQPGMVDEFQFDRADAKVVTTRIVGDLIAVRSETVPARIVARDAAAYIVQHRPNLCFIHFTDTDDTGHRYGWGSPQQVQAFADEDAALGVVFKALETAGILHDSVVIVTADHGGHARTHGSASPEDMNIPWVVWGKGVRRDYAITAPVTTYDTAATALWLLDVPCPESWDGKPVASAFGPDTIGNGPLRSPVRQAAAN
ncbi:MAG TPA: alkaline phosphatase family protein [Verrucomicrobiae bacterium]|nr:alkaline phosphatase family protein [Verrucomicrobiae bacterium]